MASHAMATGTARRKGDRNPNHYRRDQAWGSPRAGLHGSNTHATNGSPYSGRRRETQQQQQQQQQYQQQQTPMSDHEQYKRYLMHAWNRTWSELSRRDNSSTVYVERVPCKDLQDFVPVNLDECLARAHQQDKPDH